MQKIKHKFLIPVSPDSINQVMTYGKTEGDVVKLKKKWERIAMTFIEQAIDDHELPHKLVGRVAFFFKLFFAVKRNRDGDNYEAMCKGVVDAFVKLQLIPDDNADFVDDDGRRLRIDPERPRVEVYITQKVDDETFAEIKGYEPVDNGVEIKNCVDIKDYEPSKKPKNSNKKET